MSLLTRFHCNRLAATALMISSVLTLNACSAQSHSTEVRRLGAPIEGYNHSRTAAINRFSVNGNGGSNINISSGGGQTCCVSLPVTWQPGLKVIVEWEKDPDPFSSSRIQEKPFTEAWRAQMQEQRTHYTRHRAEVEVAPYDALGVVSVHFLPCNEVKVTAGIYGFGHSQYPYSDPLNMEEPSQCPNK
ncbi:MAG: hypothetical protein CVV16_02025 [Gammaproteobacteria bacterium HGW-Gammaproteobacteria-6]|nr:MAG: hypothetical protein CVV16_02025 [Gammaproteobacteria bacterium HGW-Gammaproteobacteria-6]